MSNSAILRMFEDIQHMRNTLFGTLGELARRGESLDALALKAKDIEAFTNEMTRRATLNTSSPSRLRKATVGLVGVSLLALLIYVFLLP